MLHYSRALWEQNQEKWAPMEATYGKNFILYMIEEIGEAISIIKKKGEHEIMDNELVRKHFIEELADVMMYYADVLNRFHITPEEFSQVYINKVQQNMKRDYQKEYKKIYSDTAM